MTETSRQTRAPQTRASALPADERRNAIAEATLPLLLDVGAAVTSRQIAEAAGIAEGTIFRVFDTKEDVIWAAVELGFDSSPTARSIAGIDRSLPLRRRLVEAVGYIQERTAIVVRLMGVAAAVSPDRRGPTPPGKPRGDVDELVELFRPDADALRCEPHIAAQILRSITFGGTHELFLTDDGPLSPEQIVDFALVGVAKRPTPPTR
ncbi:MAG: TetR/AcrR family transcriptional regulator [Microthrixaceae bacterium]|nr:TetR/AcrR family transcriptional regulator [Microthrixaceae bacterium]